MKYCISILLLLVVVFPMGCAKPGIYSWGPYERSIYVMYKPEGGYTPESQAERLEAHMERASNYDKPLPPGFHAHLGYLYYQMGRVDLARKMFEQEKTLYPESVVMIDRLLKNL